MTKFRRIVAMGAGSNHINLPTARQQIIKLSGKPKPTLLYLGTATFDSDGGFDRQVRAFAEEDGLAVSRLDLAFATPGAKEIQRAIEAADVVVVSGGNTLFAVRRWRTLGVDALLKKAMERGAVMAGGSAGSICWFDGGHSDSRDPTTTAGHARSSAASKAKLSAKAKKSWKYIRVSGLGFVKGLNCPHHETTQSNGLPRASDFDEMLRKRRPREVGVCIENRALLVVDGERFKVKNM